MKQPDLILLIADSLFDCGAEAVRLRFTYVGVEEHIGILDVGVRALSFRLFSGTELHGREWWPQ